MREIHKKIISIMTLLLILAVPLAGCESENFEKSGNVEINGSVYESDSLTLDLSGMELSSKDIRQLGKLKQLKILDLSDTQIADLEGIEGLSNLEEINLSNSYIKYYTIDTLCELKNLKKANFVDSTISHNYNQMKKLYEKFPSTDISPSLEEALNNNMATFNVVAKLCSSGAATYLDKCPEKLPSGIYTGELSYLGNLDLNSMPKSGADGLNEWLCLYTSGGIPREKSKCGGYYSIVIKDNVVVSTYFSDKKEILNETNFSKLLVCTSDYIVGGYPDVGVIDWISEDKGE